MFYNSILSAQVGYDHAGSRSNALGDASLTLADVYSVNNNQGALAFVERTTFGISAQNIYGIEALNSFWGAGAFVTKAGNFGVSANYFGYELFNHTKIGAAYSRKLGENVGVGIQLDYVATKATDDGSSNSESVNGSAFTFEAGIRYKPYKNLIAAARIFNPLQVKLGDGFPDEELPALLNIGISYVPSDKVIIAIEGEQRLDADLRIKTGIEYRIIEQLFLRGGYISNPSLFTCGAGVSLKRLSIDLAAQFHQQLGLTPGIGIQYSL
ncbi:MAG: hypothetical protein H7X71_04040 [Chitinophagales bacterium]|nr:hypothetical protein [Chitinophagales bacterium]